MVLGIVWNLLIITSNVFFTRWRTVCLRGWLAILNAFYIIYARILYLPTHLIFFDKAWRGKVFFNFILKSLSFFCSGILNFFRRTYFLLIFLLLLLICKSLVSFINFTSWQSAFLSWFCSLYFILWRSLWRSDWSFAV